MKRLFLLAMLFAVSFTAQSETLEDTMDILKYVETEYTLDAVGDGGLSWGVLQIQQIAVDDVNRVYGTNYTHNDAFIEECAEEIFILYVTYWAKKLEKREGRRATTADIVRIWNGGPRGYKKKTTQWYLNKYYKYKKNLYISKNEFQKKMFNRWETWYNHQNVYTYRRYLYLQDS
jgi:hypothetical protein